MCLQSVWHLVSFGGPLPLQLYMLQNRQSGFIRQSKSSSTSSGGSKPSEKGGGAVIQTLR